MTSKSSLCPKCNKRCETTHDLNREPVAVCDGCGEVWRLETTLEYARGLAADAKLGRLVRRYLTVGGQCGIGRDGDGFWASRMEEVEPDRGKTIDEALERAMGEGK